MPMLPNKTCHGTSLLSHHFTYFHCSYKCPSECKCYRNNNKSLQIVDCTNRNLTEIPKIPTIATMADLDGNNFREVPSMTFQNNSRLEVLSLNNSKIEAIQDAAFKGLNSLHSLWLDNNKIQNISMNAFVGLHNLKNISLHRNDIETLSAEAFDHTLALNNLTLQGNHLVEIILENFLTKNPNLTRLTLSENPWSCNCSFGPDFQKWIQTNIQIIEDALGIECNGNFSKEIGNISTNVITSSESIENGKHFLDGNMHNATEDRILHRNFSFCYPNISKIIHKPFENKNTIKALTVSGCVFLFMLTIALIIYSSRGTIKVCLYNRYGFRFNRKDEKHDGKRFDAFVSYSQKDQKFVTKALVPKLEQVKPYYHLCLHYRDWPIGGGIAQTICESVEQSRRTIILLSENFMTSEWCQYQFKAAHYRVLHDKTIRLIVILLDDKPPPNLDPELKLYIKTNTYLQWKDPWFWQKLKYALPDVEREPRPSGRAYYQYMAGKPVTANPEKGKVHVNGDDTDASDITDTDENSTCDGIDLGQDREKDGVKHDSVEITVELN